jgi:acetyl esterase/lipase
VAPPSPSVQLYTGPGHPFSTPASDGQGETGLRWYTTARAAPGPAVIYTHGGGMLGGSVDLYDEVVSWYVAESGVPFLSVELRLAPEATSPTSLAEDVFSGLTWLADHATDLGADRSRIAVMGDSGGGGPTAGAAILARDRDVPVAKQILIYPMLDDRNTTPGSLPAQLLTWNYDNNYTGWVTLLGDALGADDVPPAASPPGWPTSPDSRPRTSKSATSTSSETRASPTPSG